MRPIDQEKRQIMEDRLARIRAACEKGMTVYYGVGLRVLVFTARNLDTLAVRGDSLYVRHGKRWACIDYYTKITAA